MSSGPDHAAARHPRTLRRIPRAIRPDVAAVPSLDLESRLTGLLFGAALRLVAAFALLATLLATVLLVPPGAAGMGTGQTAGAHEQGAQPAPTPPGAVRRPAPAAVPAPAPDPEVLRRDLLAAINRERERAGVVLLAPAGPLDRVAQERADEIGKAGRLPGEEESFLLFARVQRRIRQAGYHPHGWTETMTASAGEVADVIAYWKGDASFRDAMGADYRDVGIGIARLGEVPFYTFLFAWPERDFFARETAPLADLAAVRDAMLAAVNQARREAGLEPLVLDDRLNAAAQEHAADMHARAYYSHWSPDGSSPRTRAFAAGYRSQAVAENIAAGELTVAGVMTGWMNSSGHRRNILDGSFRHFGVGLAVGRFEDRYRLLWVQAFGRPEAPAAPAAIPSQPRPR